MILKDMKQHQQNSIDLLGQVEELIHQILIMDQEVEQELLQQDGMLVAITDQQLLMAHMNMMALVGQAVGIYLTQRKTLQT